MSGRQVGRLGELTVGLTLVLLVGWPLLVGVASAMFRQVPEPTTAGWNGSVSSPALLGNTVRVVGLTILLSVPLGGLLAWLLTRTDLPGRSIGWAILVVQAMIPLPLQALAWLGGYGNMGRQQALGSSAWLTGWPAAAFVEAVSVLPWVVLIIGIGLRAAETELEDQARLLWPAWQVIWRITIQRAWGLIAAAGLLVAAFAATDMTVTDLIPVRTYAEESYLLSQLGLDQARLMIRATLPQLTVIGLAVAGLAYRLSRLDLERLYAGNRPRWTVPLGSARVPAAVGVALLALILVGLPLHALIWRAGRVGGGAGSGELTWTLSGLVGSLQGGWRDLMGGAGSNLRAPLPGSIVWSAIAATGSVTLAWVLVWLARRSRIWRVVTLLVFTMALATPGPIIGLAIKQAYAGISYWNRTPVLLVLGLVVRSLPYSLAVAGPTLWSWPRAWDEQARLAGLDSWREATRLTLPLTRTALAIAWLLAFVQSMGELPCAYLTYAPGYDLVSLLVWSMLHVGVESRLAAIGLILLALTLIPAGVVLFLARRLVTRRNSGR